MLSESEIAGMRERIAANQRKPWREKSRWLRCVGGPLDGMSIRVGLQPFYSMCWCCLTKDAGAVTSNYRPGDAGTLHFTGYERLGAKASCP